MDDTTSSRRVTVLYDERDVERLDRLWAARRALACLTEGDFAYAATDGRCPLRRLAGEALSELEYILRRECPVVDGASLVSLTAYLMETLESDVSISESEETWVVKYPVSGTTGFATIRKDRAKGLVVPVRYEDRELLFSYLTGCVDTYNPTR
jgi:hypothetical protein